MIFLSHLLDQHTPSYGNQNPLTIETKKSLDCGDSCNDSFLHLSAHLGTHIDLPLHFYQNGQSIENFPASFWIFEHPIIIDVKPQSLIIYDEIIDALKKIRSEKLICCDLLMVKTEIEKKRRAQDFWVENPGFSPDLYEYFKEALPALRVFGFDSISLTSFQHRDIGKVAHQRFLNPAAPILLIEDMHLEKVNADTIFKKIIVSPIRIARCDGLPCTIIGFFK